MSLDPLKQRPSTAVRRRRPGELIIPNRQKSMSVVYLVGVGNFGNWYGFSGTFAFGSIAPPDLAGIQIAEFYGDNSDDRVQLTMFGGVQIPGVGTVTAQLEGLDEVALTWNAGGWYDAGDAASVVLLVARNGSSVGLTLST